LLNALSHQRGDREEAGTAPSRSLTLARLRQSPLFAHAYPAITGKRKRCQRLALPAILGWHRITTVKPRVYIETSVPSFYHELRPEPEMVARRAWTREWWDGHRSDYALVTSVAVIEELEAGAHAKKAECLALVQDLPLLPVHDAIGAIVDTYIEHHVMPSDPRGDALHLAPASYHHCQFLLTWNCAHLANANKQEHIRHINVLQGLHVPVLTTPLELIYPEEVES